MNATLDAVTDEALDLALDVNLRSTLELLKACLPRMAARGWGRVVSVGSINQLRPKSVVTAYAATKAALNALTKGLALELAPYGIRVNAVLPGGVDTDMLRTPRLRPGESLSEPEIERRVESHLAGLSALHPLGRLGTPAEVASVIVAALDQSWQTGSLITIDGGLSLK